MIHPNFEPLLSAKADLKKLDYTNLWGSAKLDGIRAIVIDGVVMSRKMKPIPNAFVQHRFGRPEFEGFDGELVVGEPHAKDVYNATYSGVMSKDGEPDTTFYAFDHIGDPNLDYFKRLERLSGVHQHVGVVTQHPLTNYDDLLALETYYLDMGYEGLMLRAFEGTRSWYKFGRSTVKEGTLMKLKRFTDAEAIIVGFEEEMANNNEATVDAFGRTERSSHQGNKVGKGRLGALICETADGIRFNIGTGFTAEQREKLWAIRDKLVGMWAKYKCFPIGVVQAPRFPVFLGFRDPIDM